jgi:hypothetical protein
VERRAAFMRARMSHLRKLSKYQIQSSNLPEHLSSVRSIGWIGQRSPTPHAPDRLGGRGSVVG